VRFRLKSEVSLTEVAKRAQLTKKHSFQDRERANVVAISTLVAIAGAWVAAGDIFSGEQRGARFVFTPKERGKPSCAMERALVITYEALAVDFP